MEKKRRLYTALLVIGMCLLCPRISDALGAMLVGGRAGIAAMGYANLLMLQWKKRPRADAPKRY